MTRTQLPKKETTNSAFEEAEKALSYKIARAMGERNQAKRRQVADLMKRMRAICLWGEPETSAQMATYFGLSILQQRVDSLTQLYTPEQVAEALQISPDWVWRCCRDGRFPHQRVGRSIRFTQEQVDLIATRVPAYNRRRARQEQARLERQEVAQ